MNKIKKIIVVLVIMISLTGCTTYVKKDKKAVIYEPTGQTLTENILCKPTNKDLVSVYESNGVDLSKLKTCKTYSYNDTKYSGLWEAILVKPLALAIIWLGNLIGNYGLSVMIMGVLIRLALAPLSAKSIAQSKQMKEAQKELSKIEAKYKNNTEKDAMMAKSQETMAIYKKYGINPVSGCVMAFIQLPLFFAFLEAINRVPAIFENKFLTLQLGTTPWVGIGNGNYAYIALIIVIIASTYYSLKDTMTQTSGTGDQAKQSKFMLMFMLVFISVMSFNLPTAIALYWVITNIFAVVQTKLIRKKMTK